MSKVDGSGSKENVGTIILGLDKKGRIVQFDNKTQKITGYKRDEAINKKIWDFLIPSQDVEKCKRMLNSIKKNNNIDDFEIPFKSKDNEKISIIWNSFSLDKLKENQDSFCLIGKIKSVEKSNDNSKITNNKNNKLKNKKNIPKKKKSVKMKNSKTGSIKKDKKISQNSKKIKNYSSKKDHSLKDNLEKEYKKLNDRLIKLEKKDRKLELKNKVLEKNIKSLSVTIDTLNSNLKKEKYDEFQDRKNINQSNKHNFKNKFDIFGLKKTNLELEEKKHFLEKRELELEKMEEKLIEDRKEFDKKLAVLSNWKEKLLSLENEIQKRNKELLVKDTKKESEAKNQDKIIKNESSVETKEKTIEDTIDLINKIPQAAAIMQRGIIRQVNENFSDMMGNQTDSILNKSFFDFIAPEGLLEVEKYYLNRLKGANTSCYETILLIEDRKISVEVSINPTNLNGEKAEIMIFKELKTKSNKK